MDLVKFAFSKKDTKIDEIFTVDLTLCSKCQIDCEYFFNFCGLLRKHELYQIHFTFFSILQSVCWPFVRRMHPSKWLQSENDQICIFHNWLKPNNGYEKCWPITEAEVWKIHKLLINCIWGCSSYGRVKEIGDKESFCMK